MMRFLLCLAALGLLLFGPLPALASLASLPKSGVTHVTFGAGDLQGQGGVAVTGSSITSGDPKAHFQISGGVLNLTSAGVGLPYAPYLLTLNDGSKLLVTKEANAFDIASQADWDNIAAIWQGPLTGNGSVCTSAAVCLAGGKVGAHVTYPATGALPFSCTPIAAGTVTIGASTYTFRAAASVNGEVTIVAGNRAATVANLIHAINNSGGTPGTDYVVAGANASVTAAAMSGLTASDGLLVTAITAGVTGNNIGVSQSGLACGSGLPATVTSNGTGLLGKKIYLRPGVFIASHTSSTWSGTPFYRLKLSGTTGDYSKSVTIQSRDFANQGGFTDQLDLTASDTLWRGLVFAATGVGGQVHVLVDSVGSSFPINNAVIEYSQILGTAVDPTATYVGQGLWGSGTHADHSGEYPNGNCIGNSGSEFYHGVVIRYNTLRYCERGTVLVAVDAINISGNLIDTYWETGLQIAYPGTGCALGSCGGNVPGVTTVEDNVITRPLARGLDYPDGSHEDCILHTGYKEASNDWTVNVNRNTCFTGNASGTPGPIAFRTLKRSGVTGGASFIATIIGNKVAGIAFTAGYDLEVAKNSTVLYNLSTSFPGAPYTPGINVGGINSDASTGNSGSQTVYGNLGDDVQVAVGNTFTTPSGNLILGRGGVTHAYSGVFQGLGAAGAHTPYSTSAGWTTPGSIWAPDTMDDLLKSFAIKRGGLGTAAALGTTYDGGPISAAIYPAASSPGGPGSNRVP